MIYVSTKESSISEKKRERGRCEVVVSHSPRGWLTSPGNFRYTFEYQKKRKVKGNWMLFLTKKKKRPQMTMTMIATATTNVR